MKNNFIFLLLILVAPLLLSGCASRESSEDNAPINNKVIVKPVPGEMSLNGGYSETSTDSEKVKASFRFLKEKLSISHPEITLIKIQRAEIQIVAGYKIRLICEYSVIGNEELYLLESISYEDTDQNITLEYLDIFK